MAFKSVNCKNTNNFEIKRSVTAIYNAYNEFIVKKKNNVISPIISPRTGSVSTISWIRFSAVPAVLLALHEYKPLFWVVADTISRIASNRSIGISSLGSNLQHSVFLFRIYFARSIQIKLTEILLLAGMA